MACAVLFEQMWFICVADTLSIIICWAQVSFLTQFLAPIPSCSGATRWIVPSIYPVTSQLIKTRFIRSFQSYQLLSVKWLRSGSLFTAIYSLVWIRATVGGLLAGGLLAGGLLAGGLFAASGLPCAGGAFL